VRGAGSVHLRGGGHIAFHLELASGPVARRAFSLLRSYGVPCEIRTYKRRAFEQGTRYQLHLEDDARAIQALNEAGILDANLAPLGRPPRRVVGRTCCRAAYLRGAFLASGSASGPRNAHFELRTADAESVSFLAELAAADGLSLAVYERNRHAVAYAKGTEAIGELLAFLGAQEAALRLGEEAVVASTRARANRLANADHANIVRTSRAADVQLRAIRRLEREGRLDELAPELGEIARLRVRHPTLSLRELARRCEPPATKAAAHRRLARIQRLAEL
jgi:DNA-binding protein WhiA